MLSRTVKRFLGYSLLIAGFTLSAASVKSQDRKETIGIDGVKPVLQNGCPKPIALTLNATTPNVVNADFNAVQLGAPRSWLNDPALNKSFLYTFQWKQDERCCEITKAVLTVKMQSNSGGQSKTTSDAGNDGIAIMHLTNGVQPFAEPVYSNWPFNPGQAAVKTWNLTGAALSNLNANRRLSIYVQDDTKVLSATLQIWGCCLSGTQRTAVEGSSLQLAPN